VEGVESGDGFGQEQRSSEEGFLPTTSLKPKALLPEIEMIRSIPYKMPSIPWKCHSKRSSKLAPGLFAENVPFASLNVVRKVTFGVAGPFGRRAFPLP
jgi:hypothetical protein